MVQLETQTAQHLAGLVGGFFENLSDCSFEYNVEIRPGDFLLFQRDEIINPEELEKAKEIDPIIIELARNILGF